MPPTILFDISHVDFDKPRYSVEEVEATNPHRGAMRLIDSVAWCSSQWDQAATAKQIGADEFWVAGHLPGRPLFPGVLMIEAAAQLSSFATLRKYNEAFMGFVAADNFKFRGQVVPGDTLILLAQQIAYRKQRSVSLTQGWVDGRLVFEGQITGMNF